MLILFHCLSLNLQIRKHNPEQGEWKQGVMPIFFLFSMWKHCGVFKGQREDELLFKCYSTFV